jgi:hypothetical protein
MAQVRPVNNISDLIDKIAELPPDWHSAGMMSPKVLRAIARQAEQIGPIRQSAETGSGITTLLFSHLSTRHLVFAKDLNKSISQAKNSPLLNPEAVTFVEGPTQVTLPSYRFSNKLQIALIDGPHGYPFPDLEYYYFYPLIEAGGLLIIDDIQIPSIGRMVDIVKADDMFDLLEIIHNTAILRRSHAPLIDPQSDSWWLQGYNRAFDQKVSHSKRLLSYLASITPKFVKTKIPVRLKSLICR